MCIRDSSKDEILFETFAHGHTILWTIGILTSLLTATYMFRLVFLTFHGERRHEAPSAEHAEEEEPTTYLSHQPATTSLHPSHRPAPADSHSHGNHLHDAPSAMALALVVLALGSVLAL